MDIFVRTLKNTVLSIFPFLDFQPSTLSSESPVTDEGSTIFSLRARDVICCDEKGEGELRRLRIVCMSDTHGKHWDMRSKIPDGDIFIHAGDFSFKMRTQHAEDALEDFNAWLGTLTHHRKIVIAGNHEIAFNDYSPFEIQQRLSNCIYLQDSGVNIAGLKIYGSPWTSSINMGFSATHQNLEKHVWSKIPNDVDILITHSPPWNILDIAYNPREKDAKICDVCNKMHRRYGHWGSKGLRERIRAINPKVHVFGHVHDSHGWEHEDGTLFINAAQDLKVQPIFFDCIIRQSS